MDYGKLAQLSNPGNSPLGSGIVDPLGYRRWMNMDAMNQQALRQSIPLADMAAQRSQQEQTEYMAGAPGRMDQINLGNMTAAAGVKNFDRDQFAAQLKIDVNNAEQMAKLADVTQDFSGDADAYMKALETGDERLKQQIAKKHEGRKLRNGYVMGTDTNTDDALLKIAGIARANAPALQNKLAVEDKKISGRLSLENIKSLSDKEKILLRGQIADDLQNKRFAFQSSQAASKPMNDGQALVARLNAKHGNDTDSWLEDFRIIKDGPKLLGIDEKRAMMMVFPELAKNMPPAPGPRELTPSNPNTQPAPTTTQPKQPIAGSPWHKADGSKVEITKVERSKKDQTKYRITLKDGTVIEETIK